MKNIFTLLFLSLTSITFSQIKGTITDESNNPLPFVNIYVENTYIGTTSNEKGNYELAIPNRSEATLVFQYLGFKTQKHVVKTNAPLTFDVKLKEESYSLNEVVLSSKENPAIPIIRKAIANRSINSAKTAKFTADFYSRGIFRMKNAPKKIFGQEIGDLDGTLDSTGSGILYLSETVSKITFQKPDKLKERIIASKISGQNNGFSYNTAQATSYDFYDNTVELGANLISPIADNAFGYYKYTLEGTFYDDNKNLINKIKVTPKRDVDPVFEGFIYIVEDSWAIYGVDVDIKGYRMKEEFLDVMNLKQNFSYNQNNQLWAKNSQSLEFEAGIFGINFNGKFTYVYSNYDFKNEFEKKTFTNEILSFEDNANKKDTLYWNTMRPVPLTDEESTDYIRKDSISTVRNSKPYLDSIDAKNNKFNPLKVLTGYTYRNSHEKWSINYDGLIKLVHFNTVQGWHMSTGISYYKRDEETRKNLSFGANFNYGFSEEKFRTTGFFNTRLSTKTNSSLSVNGGSKAEQFNASEPISPIINTVATLFFEENFMKLYEKNFAKASYQQEVTNGIFMFGSLEYSERKPLYNTTDKVFIQNDEKIYTSNNPLDPNDYTSGGIVNHNLMKANINARINFGQKYMTRPDGKYNMRNDKYPSLFLGYEKGFAGNEDSYNYDFVAGRVYYEQTLGNKGSFAINLKGGQFFNADAISFVDYKHFNGNQTYVGTSERYLNVFNLMPYYGYSTNDSYMETHIEHNFEGYIMNRIPLINKLKSTLVLGYHQLATPEIKPYQEFTVGLDNLGFGKFRMLRVDYVRSYQGSAFMSDGVIFGLKFLNIID